VIKSREKMRCVDCGEKMNHDVQEGHEGNKIVAAGLGKRRNRKERIPLLNNKWNKEAGQEGKKQGTQ
jgi:hypothetical protein